MYLEGERKLNYAQIKKQKRVVAEEGEKKERKMSDRHYGEKGGK